MLILYEVSIQKHELCIGYLYKVKEYTINYNLITESTNIYKQYQQFDLLFYATRQKNNISPARLQKTAANFNLHAARWSFKIIGILE